MNFSTRAVQISQKLFPHKLDLTKMHEQFLLQSLFTLQKNQNLDRGSPLENRSKISKNKFFKAPNSQDFACWPTFSTNCQVLKGPVSQDQQNTCTSLPTSKLWKVKRNSLCNADRERNYFCWITAIDSSFTYLCELPTAPESVFFSVWCFQSKS